MVQLNILLLEELLSKIKDMIDCKDVINDLKTIKEVQNNIQLTGNTYLGENLNKYLIEKYPSINLISNFLNSMPSINRYPVQNHSEAEIIIKILDQDYYFIIMDPALKKGLLKK